MIVLQTKKGNDLDIRRVQTIVLCHKTESSFYLDPSKMNNYPVMVDGGGGSLNLASLKKIQDRTGLNVYIRFYGSEQFVQGLLTEVLGDE